jgi:uncharacterized protein YkwD
MGATRRRRLGLLAAALLGIAIVGAACDPAPPPPPPPPPACPGPDHPVESVVYNRVNADRQAAGLNVLAWDSQLACNAQHWANTMAGSGNFSHQDLNGVIRSAGYENFASLGENILVGPNSLDGNTIQNSWMNSPGHRANIMGWFDSVGIGIGFGADGRLWATQEFGRHF